MSHLLVGLSHCPYHRFAIQPANALRLKSQYLNKENNMRCLSNIMLLGDCTQLINNSINVSSAHRTFGLSNYVQTSPTCLVLLGNGIEAVVKYYCS